MHKGPFIKDVINQGKGICQKIILLNLVKVMTKGEGGQKSLKIDDVFYERPPTLNHVEPSLELMTSKLY